MGDAVTAGYLPADLDMYAGYIDGRYQSYQQIRARFPGKLVVAIATQAGGNVGVVFDGPPDNGTWPEVVAWVLRRRHDGVDPSVNTTSSAWAAGVQAFNAVHVAQPHWWISDWNGHQDIPSGAIAHQYESVANRYDLSVVADYWPGVDPVDKPPAPPPVTHPPAPPAGPTPEQLALAAALAFEEDDMILTHDPSGAITLISGSLVVHVQTLTDAQAFQAAGVKQVDISAQMATNIVTAAAELQGKLTGTLAVSGSLVAG
jgi:hypothetical protein